MFTTVFEIYCNFFSVLPFLTENLQMPFFSAQGRIRAPEKLDTSQMFCALERTIYPGMLRQIYVIILV